MTSPDATAGPPPPTAEAPDFRGALFLYVACQVVLSAAAASIDCLDLLLGASIYPQGVDAQLAQTMPWETTAHRIAILLSIALCIYVANRHELSIGQTALLFLTGYSIAGMVCAPFYALAAAAVLADQAARAEWMEAYAGSVAIYVIGGSIAFYFCRRQLLSRASRAA